MQMACAVNKSEVLGRAEYRSDFCGDSGTSLQEEPTDVAIRRLDQLWRGRLRLQTG